VGGCNYLVSEDDIERPILFIESKATQKTRTLITFNNENNVIEIPGTEVLSQSGGVFCIVTKAILFFVF
jgi:agmatine/peptidylarginine deiminase